MLLLDYIAYHTLNQKTLITEWRARINSGWEKSQCSSIIIWWMLLLLLLMVVMLPPTTLFGGVDVKSFGPTWSQLLLLLKTCLPSRVELAKCTNLVACLLFPSWLFSPLTRLKLVVQAAHKQLWPSKKPNIDINIIIISCYYAKSHTCTPQTHSPNIHWLESRPTVWIVCMCIQFSIT